MAVDISVVIPAYNEEKSIKPLYNELKEVLEKLNKTYEVIFVDDGSTDKTLEVLEDLYKKNKNVKVITFKKNFGKAAALSAGFEHAEGKVILTMDADLQDSPTEIPRFLEKIEQGYDLVVGWKYPRKDPLTKIMLSKIFNSLVRLLTKIKLHDSDCNFRAMKKEVLDDLHLYGGLYRYIPSIAFWKGYKICEIKVQHRKRKFGKSKYGISRVFKGFFDLLTIKFLISFSTSPLHLFGTLGFFLLSIGLISGFYLLYLKYFLKQLIGNRPLLILCLVCIISGVQFITFGLIAEMLTYMNLRKEKKYTINKILK